MKREVAAEIVDSLKEAGIDFVAVTTGIVTADEFAAAGATCVVGSLTEAI